MDPIREKQLLITRRHFFGRTAAGIGVAALGSLVSPSVLAALTGAADKHAGGLSGVPHFTPKAKRVI
jgi:hypothetical protein